MINVLYVGEGAINLHLPVEAADLFPRFGGFTDNGEYLSAPLRAAGMKVSRIFPYAARAEFPRTAEALAQYDVLILSDVSHDGIVLYEDTPVPDKPQGPNRLKEIVRYVENGGGLVFCGGWFTYQGHYGKGRWYGTPVAEILPLEILPLPDDRVETPEGAIIMPRDIDHPLFAELDWVNPPFVLGYNKTGALANDATLLATVGEDDDPFLAIRQHDLGRVAAITGDPAPDWGNGFHSWPGYASFWQRLVRWTVGRDF